MMRIRALRRKKNFCGKIYRNFLYKYIGMKSGNPDRGGKIDLKKIVRAGRPAVALGTRSATRI